MPTLTTTIEDTSPVIVYSESSGSADWYAGSSKDDTSVEQYSQSSFMVTNVSQAQASFSFYGTGVQLFGAKKSNHDVYQISIDALVYPPVNGSASDPIFQTPLFSSVSLTNGLHTVRMKNLGTGFLDLDFITWQTSVGEDDETLVASTAQDTDPSFNYQPAAQWTLSPPNLGMFSGGSGHVTTVAGASVEYKFTGKYNAIITSVFVGCDAVAIYGPVGPAGAPYSASLNGAASTNYTANKAFYRPQMMLFQASNLGPGEHSVKLQSEAWDNAALTLAIDYAEVYTTASLGKSRLSTGAIVAIAIGGIFGLCILAASLIYCLRIRRKGGKYFTLKGKSERHQSLVAEAFNYRPVSYADTVTPSPHHTVSHEGSLHSRPSQGTLGGQGFQQMQTPPSTGLWPPTSGGTSGMYTTLNNSDHIVQGPNTQVITIPFTPDGKYRPDLVTAPQLLPPPIRRAPSDGQTLQLRQTRSQMEMGAIPRGAGHPAPNTSEGERRVAFEEPEASGSGERHSWSDQTHAPAPPLQPARRQPDVAVSPPEYRDDTPNNFLSME